MTGADSERASLEERLDRVEVQNRLLKRAMAVLLALTGVGIFLGQHAVRTSAEHVRKLEQQIQRDREAKPAPADDGQDRASSSTAEPR
jgi:hypothetical protein